MTYFQVQKLTRQSLSAIVTFFSISSKIEVPRELIIMITVFFLRFYVDLNINVQRRTFVNVVNQPRERTEREKQVAWIDYFSHSISRRKKISRCYARDESACKTHRRNIIHSKYLFSLSSIPRPLDMLNANARWGFELPPHYYCLIATKILPEAIESLGCRRGRRTRESAEGVVTATNDVSANLTLRQIDLSRKSPIVACRMFPRVFALFVGNSIRPRSTSNSRSRSRYSLTSPSVRLDFFTEIVVTYRRSPTRKKSFITQILNSKLL